MFEDFEDGITEFANYTLMKKAETYEVRVYEPSTWACVEMLDVKNNGKDKAKKHLKQKLGLLLGLMDYVTGNNSMDVELGMTAPMTSVGEDLGDGVMKGKICYYLPSQHQLNPPLPRNEIIFIERRPQLKVAARTFGGWRMDMAKWEEQKAALKADLQEAGEDVVDFNIFYGAIYNPPTQMEDRRNEVWYEMA
ncbi:hypothetical protein Pmani_009414 [Petrolisthes manimaculis]|uniref:Heme-binding protein 2 n=1 Tax=Petrolisthes manimaculis TaxID=1843537 RepID=A0AAE1Q4Z9_9EUCA|nr:hypothetical protein Pmani_009414 [Petrolisthes manimaculis]